MEKLLKHIRSLVEFSDESWEQFSNYLTIKKFNKGDFLLKNQEYCDTVFYIQTGFCRLFQEVEEDEINLNFHFEDEFVTNIKSSLNKEKSEYSIQAYENLVVVEMKKSTITEDFINGSKELQAFSSKMLQLLTIKQEEHLKLFKLCSPQQRYEYIEKYQPEILQRVPLHHLASYLGVTRRTLTRIRKNRLFKNETNVSVMS
jgi:CRP-like cAMP-binding protein